MCTLALISSLCVFHAQVRSCACNVFEYPYYNCPSGNYFEYQAFAIGYPSQAAKTYLECGFVSILFPGGPYQVWAHCSKGNLSGEQLNSSICTISVLGVEEPFHVLDEATVKKLIDAFEISGQDETPAAEPDAAL